MRETVKKTSLALVSLWASAAPFIAAAQATCTVNGQQVPCDAGAVGAGIGAMLVLGLFGLVIGIGTTVFWLLMIIHAAKHDIDNKALWIVVMVLTGFIGSLVYYFAVKRNFKEQMAAPNMAAANAAAAPMPAAPPMPQSMPSSQPSSQPPQQPPAAPSA